MIGEEEKLYAATLLRESLPETSPVEMGDAIIALTFAYKFVKLHELIDTCDARLFAACSMAVTVRGKLRLGLGASEM